jgi:hypothetical protein
MHLGHVRLVRGISGIEVDAAKDTVGTPVEAYELPAAATKTKRDGNATGLSH